MEIKMREKMERVGMEERVTFTELISFTRMERNEKTFHSMINTWKERIDLRILHSDPLSFTRANIDKVRKKVS